MPTDRVGGAGVNLLVPWVCRAHGAVLAPTADGRALACARGCRVPVLGGIPRFVPADNYAAAFGRQWLRFRQTQLDSHTGLSISRDRLTRLVGGDLGVWRGRLVLEVGCGAGRFTELLLAAGARVVAVDLSAAVEANHATCGHVATYQLAQADVTALPLAPGQFHFVLVIGMVQHTPDPEATMTALARQVRPGGWLVLDHYAPGYPATWSRRVLRGGLLRLGAGAAGRVSYALTAALWPLHRALWGLRGVRGLPRLRRAWLALSPVVDYHDAYPQLPPRLLREWALLDTHDTLTDRYKHLRSPEQLTAHLAACGLTEISATYGGNGVEVRARRPAAAGAGGAS